MLCVLPRNMSEIDIRNDGLADWDSAERSRKKAIRVYLAVSLVQVILGLAVLAFSSVAVHYGSEGGFPYFYGGFAIATMMIATSMIAFRVYNKGPYFSTCVEARKEVLCAISLHRGVSFFMFFVSVCGVAIIWMYGLCIANKSECSYSNHFHTNNAIATVLFVLGCLGVITALVGIVLIRKFGAAFGLEMAPGRHGGLRYSGFSADVIGQLRRQNAVMQRQLDNQTLYPNMPQGCQGFANFGFEPPTPPPYSLAAVEVSIVGNNVHTSQNVPTIETTSSRVSVNPPKYSDLELSVLPADPPPPYKETSGDSDSTRTDHTKL